MRRTASAIALVALLLGTYGLTQADRPRPHRSTGIVTAISSSKIVLRQPEGRHILTITPATEILIAAEDGVSRIGVGDYVGEECLSDGKGGQRVVTLTLYRPAWVEISSPEY